MGNAIDIKTRQEIDNTPLTDEEFDQHIAYMNNAIAILKKF